MKRFRRFLVVLAAGVLAVSGLRVWSITGAYRQEARAHEAVLAYRPREGEILNQGVIDLQAKYPDTVGWLAIPGTRIDYPFVWYEDHDRYLRSDLDGNHAMAGTLFMDSRCARDFSSRNTVIYGHNMRNGSMFGTLKLFADKAFFEANRAGAIYLPRENLDLEFFAFMVIKATDKEIYSTWLDIAYVKRNARLYRDIELTGGDRFVTLSTCSYEFDGARMVLLARVG